MQPSPRRSQRVGVIAPEGHPKGEIQVQDSPQITRIRNLVPHKKHSEESEEVMMKTPLQSSRRITDHDILEELDDKTDNEHFNEAKMHTSPQSMQQQNAIPSEVDNDEEMLDEFREFDQHSPYINNDTLGLVKKPSWVEQLMENAGSDGMMIVEGIE